MSATATAAMLEPEVEVVAKPQRRRFTAEYKRKIVRAADACKTPGAVGALLRREGLYPRTWRCGARRATAESWQGRARSGARSRGPEIPGTR